MIIKMFYSGQLSFFALLILTSFVRANNFPCGKVETSTIGNPKQLLTIKYTCDTLDSETVFRHKTTYKGQFKHGTITSYYYSGKVEYVSEYRNGSRDGAYTSWYENGNVEDSSSYVNGKQVGMYKRWKQDGKPEFIKSYDSTGAQHGLFQNWYENGFVKDSTIYSRGQVVSNYVYYPNGKLSYYMINTRPDFIESGKFYNIKGKLVGEIKNGNGKAPRYDEKGKLITTWIVKNGQFVE